MTHTNKSSLRIGVCGFCLPQAELFRRLSVLEVQQTFYWPPQLKTVERWRRTAPPDFEFTLKAFQAITHTYNHRTYRKVRFSADELAECGGFRDTQAVRNAWELTRTLADALAATVVVFQCPPSFADMARKFLQMGWTRARRYANHPSGRKYDRETKEELPRGEDPEKAEAARIFYVQYVEARETPRYQELKREHLERYL